MNPTPDTLEELLHALCEGTLTADARQRLEELVATDPSRRGRFIEYLSLHAALGWHNKHAVSPHVSSSNLTPPAHVVRPRVGVLGYLNQAGVYSLVSAAAVLFALLTLLAVVRWQVEPATRPTARAAPPSVHAHVTGLAECVWNGETAEQGSGLRSGRRLRLQRGTAEIAFPQGVRLLLHGPADLRIDAKNQVTLARGELYARVAQGAVGFRVETPRATLIDRGTEFGLRVDEHGGEVHVRQGAVEVRVKPSRAGQPVQTEQLAAPSAVVWRVSGKTTLLSAAKPRAEAFVRQLPYATHARPIVLAPQVDLTVRDDEVVIEDHLLLAGRDEHRASYRSLLRFDLQETAVAPGELRRATLRLYLHESQQYGATRVSAVPQAWDASQPPPFVRPTDDKAQSIASSVGDQGHFTPPRQPSYHEVEVTDLVRQWLTNPAENHGFQLEFIETTNGVVFTGTLRRFGSSRGLRPPQLVLELETADALIPPTPQTIE